MTAYTDQIATALQLIAEAGKEYSLKRFVDGVEGVDTDASPPENPWDADFTDQLDPGDDDPTTYQATAVVLPYRAGRGSDTLKDNIAETASMRWFLMAASGMTQTPRAGDEVTIEGEAWSILGLTTLGPDGTAIIHKAVIKQG